MVVSPIALKRKTQILLTADRTLPAQASACLFGCLSRHHPALPNPTRAPGELQGTKPLSDRPSQSLGPPPAPGLLLSVNVFAGQNLSL